MSIHGEKAKILLLELMQKLNARKPLAVVTEDERLIIKCGAQGISPSQSERLRKLFKNSSHHIPKTSWQEVNYENSKAFSLSADAVDALNKHGNFKRLEHIIPMSAAHAALNREEPLSTPTKPTPPPSEATTKSQPDTEKPSVLSRLKSFVKKKP